MVEYKIGDKIRFLNEKGGGTISGFISNNMVNVIIEDGFEVPILLKEIVKIDPKNAAGRFFDNDDYSFYDKNVIKNNKTPIIENNNENNNNNSIEPIYKKASTQFFEGVYLIYCATNVENPTAGAINVKIVNNSNYELIYNFLLPSNEDYIGYDYDVIPPYSSNCIGTVSFDEIEKWCNALVQAIFHNLKPSPVLNPLHSIVNIKPKLFYAYNSYKTFELTENHAIVVNLSNVQNLVSKPSIYQSIKYSNDAAVQKKVSNIIPTTIIEKHKIANKIAEVDLHISALTEDYNNMSNGEILRLQLNYFKQTLESAIAEQFIKVYYIHGVGNGSLKNAITDYLIDYDCISYGPASFAKYGNGAIELNLKHS